MLKEDLIIKTFPLGNTENLVAPNVNNNIDNNSTIMLDTSDDKDELEYEISDEDYDLYYHDELFVKYNLYPTLKRVHNKEFAPITLLICNSIQG